MPSKSKRKAGAKENAAESSSNIHFDKELMKDLLAAWRDGSTALPMLNSSYISETLFNHTEEINFPVILSAQERKYLHNLAVELGLYHTSLDEETTGGRYICISKCVKELNGANGVAKPVTPHSALKLGSMQRAHLYSIVKTHHNPTEEPYIRYISGIIQNGPVETDDLSGYSVDLAKSPCVIIDTREKLYDLARVLEASSEFSFDLEMHSERSYYGITCLIQISCPCPGDKGSSSASGQMSADRCTDYIVDCLAVWSDVGAALGPVFANPRVVKIGHALTSDITSLFRDFGIIIRTLFDTQVGWAVLNDHGSAGGIGLAPLLANYCAADNCGENMSSIKHKLSRFDWRRRPLPLYALHYAQMDVHLLIPLAHILMRDLVRRAVAEDKDNLFEEDRDQQPTEYINMVFYQSQVNASRLWVPKKPVPRAAAFASFNPVAYPTRRVHEINSSDDEGEDCDLEEWTLTKNAEDGVQRSGHSVAVQLDLGSQRNGIDAADFKPPDDDPASNLEDKAIHVHVSGSLKKLGKDIRQYRKKYKSKKGLYGSVMWTTDENVLVAQRLLEWRDIVSREMDESPAYVCPSTVLVKLVESQPNDLEALLKAVSPVPELILRLQQECANNNHTVGHIRTLGSCRCITTVIRDALTEYHSLVQNFVVLQKIEEHEKASAKETNLADDHILLLSELEEDAKAQQQEADKRKNAGRLSDRTFVVQGKAYVLGTIIVGFLISRAMQNS